VTISVELACGTQHDSLSGSGIVTISVERACGTQHDSLSGSGIVTISVERACGTQHDSLSGSPILFIEMTAGSSQTASFIARSIGNTCHDPKTTMLLP
jgi:Ethanolamine utilization protein EutJ (predicted chaperonin)